MLLSMLAYPVVDSSIPTVTLVSTGTLVELFSSRRRDPTAQIVARSTPMIST